jgi:hypothetical protein
MLDDPIEDSLLGLGRPTPSVREVPPCLTYPAELVVDMDDGTWPTALATEEQDTPLFNPRDTPEERERERLIREAVAGMPGSRPYVEPREEEEERDEMAEEREQEVKQERKEGEEGKSAMEKEKSEMEHQEAGRSTPAASLEAETPPGQGGRTRRKTERAVFSATLRSGRNVMKKRRTVIADDDPEDETHFTPSVERQASAMEKEPSGAEEAATLPVPPSEAAPPTGELFFRD